MSKIAFLLSEAAAKTDSALSGMKSSKHTIRSAEKDIQVMVKTLVSHGIPRRTAGRSSNFSNFSDPGLKGIMKMEAGWIRKYLARKESCLSEEDVDENEDLPRRAITCEDEFPDNIM